MGWELMVLILLGVLVALMLTGMPIALVFLVIIVVGANIFWGEQGLDLVINGLYSGLAQFSLIPIVLFILMGEVLFQSGIGPTFMRTLESWMGRIPGRLALLSVGGGVLFSVLTGVSAASVAMLSSQLVPEMEKRGYKRSMSLGPILGSGGLAIMIPPSGMAILLGVLGEISIRSILMAIIIPGLLMAVLMAIFIIVRCKIDPLAAPAYDVPKVPLKEKLHLAFYTLVPVLVVVFLVTGVILLGVCTPTEASATGAIGMFGVAAFHKKLTWDLVKRSVKETLRVVVMIMAVIAGAKLFSSILSFSGASAGLAEAIIGVSVPPMVIIALMMLIVLLLGMFMESASIMMICLPIFLPVVSALGFNLVWFAVIFLIAIEIGLISPPFGLCLFVMKGQAPKGVTMGEIIAASVPFMGLHILAIIMVAAFPIIALWLPSVI